MIKTDNRFFDDLAKVATGAVGALSGVKQQISTEIRTQINRFMVEIDVVPREDFEIVEAMVREARIQNQKLAERIATLEAKLGVTAKAAPQKKTTTKKVITKNAKTKPAKKAGKKKAW